MPTPHTLPGDLAPVRDAAQAALGLARTLQADLDRIEEGAPAQPQPKQPPAPPPSKFARTPNGDAPALFSSKDHDWATPDWLYQALDRRFRFTLDAAAVPATAKAKSFYTPADDALAQPWPGRVYLNPPYGRVIGEWIDKAYHEATAGAADLVVCLIPSRTDTAYWHDFVRFGEVWFVRGRIKFERPEADRNSAPFPSAIVIFRPGHPTPTTAYWDPAEPLPNEPPTAPPSR